MTRARTPRWPVVTVLVPAAVLLAVVLLLAAPRSAQAEPVLEGSPYVGNGNNSNTVEVEVTDAVAAGEILVAHVVAATSASPGGVVTIECIDAPDGWELVSFDSGPEGPFDDHAAAVFYRTGAALAGSEHEFVAHSDGGCTVPHDPGDPGDGDVGITAVVLRYSGVDLSDPVFGEASDSGGTNTDSVAPNVDDAPAGAEVLRLFSYPTAAVDARIVAGAEDGDCNEVQSDQLYGDPPPQGSPNHALGGWGVTQESGPADTEPFAATFCAGSDSQEPAWVAFTVVLNPAPATVTKTGSFEAGDQNIGTVEWTITVTNENDEDLEVHLEDSVVLEGEVLPAGSSIFAVGLDFDACDPAEIGDQPPSFTIDCTVPAADESGPGVVEVTVTLLLVQRCDVAITADNTVDAFLVIDGTPAEQPFAVVDAEDITVPANTDLCPTIEKSGVQVGTHDDWTWTITIDNTGAENPPGDLVLTDPGVELVDGDDGVCEQDGDDIECELASDEVYEITVIRESPGVRCHPRTELNTITAATFTVDNVSVLDPIEYDLGELQELPEDIEATVPGMPSLCDPQTTPTPEPTATATPTATPEPVEGCESPETPHATWNPTPVVPGVTIAIWGGGNVDDFPAPLATSYWTTVNGNWVGYIPGAPAFVNAAFLAAFPDGEVPPCTGFSILHR